jgi:hypothetical protein
MPCGWPPPDLPIGQLRAILDFKYKFIFLDIKYPSCNFYDSRNSDSMVLLALAELYKRQNKDQAEGEGEGEGGTMCSP